MGRIWGHEFIKAALAALLMVATGKLAAQELVPLEAYGELPGVEDVAISDTGDHVALFARIGESRSIVILDRDLKPVRAVAADGTKFRGFRFVGDEALLVYTSTTIEVSGFVADRYEMTQALIVPLDQAREAAAVFSGNPGLHGAIHGNHGLRMVDGKWKGFFGALEFRRDSARMQGFQFDHGRPFLYAYDFDLMDESRVARAPPEGVFRDWLIAADGSVAATFDIDRTSGAWKIRNADNDVIAEGSNRNGDAGLVGLGQDGTSVIYSYEDPESERTDWFELPLAGGTPEAFLAGIEIERAYWNRNTGEFLGYLEDSEERQQVFFDPEIQSRAELVDRSFAELNGRMMEWSADMGRVIVHTQGNRDSGTWFLVDVEGMQAQPLGYDRPLITSDLVGPVSTIRYTAQDGLGMDGILTLPPGREAAGLPVIVLPHGGPHAHDSEGFDWWAQAFASRGYAVFQPNFRGSTGRGASFSLAAHGEWGRKMQTDISDGLAVLVEQGIVDPDRACIVGASYGGYAALAGVTLQQDLYRCAVSVAGISDIWIMYRTDSREASGSRIVRRSLREELGPDENWNAISPRNFAQNADAPILLIHGIDDTVVPFEQSDKMADALKDAGKPFELIELEGEDHWLSLPETRQRMLAETMAFVLQHNPPN